MKEVKIQIGKEPDKELDRLLAEAKVHEYGPQSAYTSIELPKDNLRYVVGPSGNIMEKHGRTLLGFGRVSLLKPDAGDSERVGRILSAHIKATENPSVVKRDETMVGGRLAFVGQHSLADWERALDKVVGTIQGFAPVGVARTLKERTIKEYLKAWSSDPGKWDPEGNFHTNIFIYAAKDLGYDLGRTMTVCIMEVAQTELLKRFKPEETARELEKLRRQPKEASLKEAMYQRAGYQGEDLWWVKTT